MEEEKKKVMLSTAEAIEVIQQLSEMEVTLPTLLAWTQKHKLGKKLGGRWRINRQKLENFIKEA